MTFTLIPGPYPDGQFEVEDSIQHWVDTWNQNPRPFLWHRTADEILDAIATYCERISDSGR